MIHKMKILPRIERKNYIETFFSHDGEGLEFPSDDSDVAKGSKDGAEIFYTFTRNKKQVKIARRRIHSRNSSLNASYRSIIIRFVIKQKNSESK